MSEQPRDAIEELIGQMEAAGSLIESLEEEVARLRRDLESANVALGAAREEVSARGRALEDRDREKDNSEEEVSALRSQMDEMKSRHADDQIQLRNEHINEIAGVRRSLEEQRRADVAAASSDERVESLKEELRREREALEDRHRADLEALEATSKQWEEKLREGYREQEERHQAEFEAALREAETQRVDLEQKLRAEFEAEMAAEKASANERYDATMQALKTAAEGRQTEIQRDYQAVVESQQKEIESLRAGIEDSGRRVAEERKSAEKEVKKLADGRERELKKNHAMKIAEANRDAERRISTLQAQKEADNKALAARHAEELARQRREYEERLFAEDERRKQETWALEERISDLKIQRETELRSYGARFRQIEATNAAKESAAAENLERVVAGFGREISSLEDKISSVESGLEESEGMRSRLEDELATFRSRLENGRIPSLRRENRERTKATPEIENRKIRELDARRVLDEEKIEVLQSRLREIERDRDRKSEELDRALGNLKKISDPAQRLREGITLFNESEHARAVASISKALGLPKVHAGMDDSSPARPVLTFVWEGMAWRKYVSDPTEGIEEPRVYLSGTGDDTAEVNGSGNGAGTPNARMDSKGRLMLGVQAR